LRYYSKFQLNFLSLIIYFSLIFFPFPEHLMFRATEKDLGRVWNERCNETCKNTWSTSEPKTTPYRHILHRFNSNPNNGEFTGANSSMVPLRSSFVSLSFDRISCPRFGKNPNPIFPFFFPCSINNRWPNFWNVKSKSWSSSTSGLLDL